MPGTFHAPYPDCYRCPVVPQKVHVEVSINDGTARKGVRPVAATSMELTANGQEKTALRFKLDAGAPKAPAAGADSVVIPRKFLEGWQDGVVPYRLLGRNIQVSENNVTAGELDMLLEEGKILNMQDQHGNPLRGKVTNVGDETVTMDFNHPMAGEDLYFSGEVVGVREATEEELDHGHVHGPGGHEH